jgi:hypothetical protein
VHDDNGRDSTHVLAFLRAMQRHGGIEADVLLFNCGLHDIKTNPATGEKQVSPDLYETNLSAIIQVVREMGLKIIWVRTTPVDDGVHNRLSSEFHRHAVDCETYNAIADDMMRAFQIASIDLYSLTRNLGTNLYCDHVHFHDHIRQKQAAYIAGWLERHIR